jgi:hypothetical protein
MRKKIAIALQIVMLLQGALWVVLAVAGLTAPDAGAAAVPLAVLMLAYSALFIVLSFMLNKDVLILKLFTAAFITVNLILSITDQAGLLDYCVLVVNALLLSGYIYLCITDGKARSRERT